MSWFSTIPFLFASQFMFLALAARRAANHLTGPSSAMPAALSLGTAMLAWGAISGWLSLSGFYDGPVFLGLFPGFWFALVPMVIAFALVGSFAPLRRGLADIARQTPAHWFVGIQALRVAALGTLIRSLQDAFPHHVEIAMGLTDLAYGVSALFLYPLAKAGRLSRDALVIWHAVGILVIVVPGGAAIQTGLPGPMQLFAEPPTAEAMFDFPMVLAPSVVVPVFMMLNMLAIAAARSPATQRQPAS